MSGRRAPAARARAVPGGGGAQNMTRGVIDSSTPAVDDHREPLSRFGIEGDHTYGN